MPTLTGSLTCGKGVNGNVFCHVCVLLFASTSWLHPPLCWQNREFKTRRCWSVLLTWHIKLQAHCVPLFFQSIQLHQPNFNVRHFSCLIMELICIFQEPGNARNWFNQQWTIPIWSQCLRAQFARQRRPSNDIAVHDCQWWKYCQWKFHQCQRGSQYVWSEWPKWTLHWLARDAYLNDGWRWQYTEQANQETILFGTKWLVERTDPVVQPVPGPHTAHKPWCSTWHQWVPVPVQESPVELFDSGRYFSVWSRFEHRWVPLNANAIIDYGHYCGEQSFIGTTHQQ